MFASNLQGAEDGAAGRRGRSRRGARGAAELTPVSGLALCGRHETAAMEKRATAEEDETGEEQRAGDGMLALSSPYDD